MSRFSFRGLTMLSAALLIAACGGGGDNDGVPEVNPWQGMQLLESRTETAGNARIAFDPNGNAIALWNQRTLELGSAFFFFNVYASRYTVGAGWDAPRLVNDTANDTADLEIALDANGNAIALWREITDDDIQFRRYNANSDTWLSIAPP